MIQISLAPDGSFHLHTSARTTLTIPVSEAGARYIAAILHARSYDSDQRIGTRSFPVQDEVDKWLRTEGKRKREEESAAEMAAKLEALGLADLDLAGLDISI